MTPKGVWETYEARNALEIAYTQGFPRPEAHFSSSMSRALQSALITAAGDLVNACDFLRPVRKGYGSGPRLPTSTLQAELLGETLSSTSGTPATFKSELVSTDVEPVTSHPVILFEPHFRSSPRWCSFNQAPASEPRSILSLAYTPNRINDSFRSLVDDTMSLKSTFPQRTRPNIRGFDYDITNENDTFYNGYSLTGNTESKVDAKRRLVKGIDAVWDYTARGKGTEASSLMFTTHSLQCGEIRDIFAVENYGRPPHHSNVTVYLVKRHTYFDDSTM